MGLFYYKIFDRQVHIRVHHPVAPAKESADQGQQSAHSGQRDFYLPGAQILFTVLRASAASAACSSCTAVS